MFVIGLNILPVPATGTQKFPRAHGLVL